MDRRSWLWRRKYSEKFPGETESSGSLSSHSEKFSDDQGYPTHNTQSAEFTSKSVSADEEVNDNVKTLTDKLSAALLKIGAKEELVKQHAKVAEEAVSGWEKAETEMLVLKQQLEAAMQKISALEDRVGHLDGALKECMRQLRQAREEQEQKIQEAIGKKIHEWESTKAELEHQLLELQTQLKTAKTETAAVVDSDLYWKFEAAEKENSRLKLELLSRAEEIKFRILERDLSTKAAEIASKQHLESIKKAAKLEAECRRLKAVAHKVSPANKHKSFSVSSIYAESFPDSQPDNWERLLAVETDMQKASSLEKNEGDPSQSDALVSSIVKEPDQFRNKKTLAVHPPERNLMDDFLEMERLAALPDTLSGNSYLEAGPEPDQADSGENVLKAELEAATYKTSELEDKLEKIEQEKEELVLELTECRMQLEISRGQLKEAEMKLIELNSQLALANELKQAAMEETTATDAQRKVVESRLRVAEDEIKTLGLKIGSLEADLEKEWALSAEHISKCQKFNDELLQMKNKAKLKHEAGFQPVESVNAELKMKQDKELAVATSKLVECQKTISSLGHQLKSLATLEDFLIDFDKPLNPTTDGSQSSRNAEASIDLCFTRDNSDESPKAVSNYFGDSKNGGTRESILSQSRSIVDEKSRNGIGKFIPEVGLRTIY